MEQNEELAIQLYNTVKASAEDGWRDNVANRGKKLKKIVSVILEDKGFDIETIMNIIKANPEF